MHSATFDNNFQKWKIIQLLSLSVLIDREIVTLTRNVVHPTSLPSLAFFCNNAPMHQYDVTESLSRQWRRLRSDPFIT
jgi:hypothetical protein